MSNGDIGDAATAAAATLGGLAPGDLAELRRMDSDDVAPWFWRLVTRHGAIRRREEDWMHVIRILAILTPRGDPEKRSQLHTRG